MNNKRIILFSFILVAIVQLYVPAKMIFERESVLRTGTAYKFKAAPIDPYDPFRGKFITLTLQERTTTVQNEDHWTIGETVYVLLTTDANGFAKIRSVSKVRPPKEHDFVKAKVSFVSTSGSNKLTIEYPFHRYYMEESKAYNAELAYRQSLMDTNRTTFALVNVKNGEAVLQDVLIDGTSIREIVKKQTQE